MAASSQDPMVRSTNVEVVETGARRTLASLWWLPLIRGILLILFAVVMYVWPGVTLISLITFLGAYWLVGGVFDVVEGIMGHTFRSRTWLIIGGLISILAGFMLMSQPVISGFLTTQFVLYFLAFATIVAGIMHLFAGRSGHFSWGSFFLGALYIIFGVIILANPLLSVATMIWLLPAWAVVTGIFSIVAAFMLRGLDENVA